MKDTEVTEKIGEVIEEIREEKIMAAQEHRDSIMGEATVTADREEAHEESARRLKAKGSLL